MNIPRWTVALALLALLGALLIPDPRRPPKRTTSRAAPQPAQPESRGTIERPEPSREAPPPPAPRQGEFFVLVDGVRVSFDTFLSALGRALVFEDGAWLDALGKKTIELEGDAITALLVAGRLPSNLFVRVAAVELLGRMRSQEALPLLGDSLASREPFLQNAALRALERIGGLQATSMIARAIPAMLDPGLRIRAAQALARAAGEEAYAALLGLLRDPDERVRAVAALALGRRGDPRAVTSLVATATTATHPRTLLAALEAAFALDDRAFGPAQVADLLDRRPEARGEIERRLRGEGTLTRFNAPYPPGFFDDGGSPVPFVEGEHARIGILVDPGESHMDVAEIGECVFSESPFDRYREFFFLRLASEYEEDLSSGAPRLRAYDAHGRPVPLGVGASLLDGTFLLRFVSKDELMPGVSGVTRGREARVTPESVLHEVGHAFARLADEYDDALAGDLDGANLEPRATPEPKWQPLVDHGFVPRGRFPRVEVVDGQDTGRFVVPSGDCFMNNHRADDRYCPVCQLELIEQISKLTGASHPW